MEIKDFLKNRIGHGKCVCCEDDVVIGLKSGKSGCICLACLKDIINYITEQVGGSKIVTENRTVTNEVVVKAEKYIPTAAEIAEMQNMRRLPPKDPNLAWGGGSFNV